MSKFSIDADGSPFAYHPNNIGLDDLSCAGHPGNWWGLACNQYGMPYVQSENDPAPGYYISTTALVDHSKVVNDPHRYVDASTVPYIVVPPELRGRGVRLGDIGMVVYGARQSAAIVADIGPHNEYGEGSIALADMLGIPSNPKTGGVANGVTWVIFPGSFATPPWPCPKLCDIGTRLYQNWRIS